MSARISSPSMAARDQVVIPTRLRSKHLLSAADLSREEIHLVLETAQAMKEIGRRPIKKVPTLRGKTVVNLFFEPSTRTRGVVRDCREATQRRRAERRRVNLERRQGRDPG